MNTSPYFAGGRMRARIPGLADVHGRDVVLERTADNTRAITGHLFSLGPDFAAFVPRRPADLTGEHLATGGTESAMGRLLFSTGEKPEQTLVGRTQIEPKTWYYVALVRDGARVMVYLNGSSEPEISGEIAAVASRRPREIFYRGAKR